MLACCMFTLPFGSISWSHICHDIVFTLFVSLISWLYVCPGNMFTLLVGLMLSLHVYFIHVYIIACLGLLNYFLQVYLAYWFDITITCLLVACLPWLLVWYLWLHVYLDIMFYLTCLYEILEYILTCYMYVHHISCLGLLDYLKHVYLQHDYLRHV